jgi:hypothetical protein
LRGAVEISIPSYLQGFPELTKILLGSFHSSHCERSLRAATKFPKPTKLLGASHRLPINHAFFPGGLVLGEPKESPLNLVDELYTTRRILNEVR